MNQLTVEAKTENLGLVLDFINAELEAHKCNMKTQMQIDVAVEEIFVNIAHYAYKPGSGDATVVCQIHQKPLVNAEICFIDSGIPFNPLERADPDVHLSLEARQIGGLGIFMVKKSMDSVKYKFEDGKNIFIMTKYFQD